jgi:hypothetical protein
LSGSSSGCARPNATHIYVDRYFLMDFPAAALLLGMALDRLRPPLVAWAAVLVLTVGRFALIPPSYGVPNELGQAASFVLAQAAPGDCITFDVPQTQTTEGVVSEFAYYAAHARRGQVLPRAVLPPLSWTSVPATYVEPPDRQQFSAVRASCRRLWFGIEHPATGQVPFYALDVNWFQRHGWHIVVNQLFPGMRIVLVGPPNSSAGGSAGS